MKVFATVMFHSLQLLCFTNSWDLNVNDFYLFILLLLVVIVIAVVYHC